MKKHSVIIDCDTGTDDAVAIIAALGSEELDIRAITTVCGNVDLAYTAANTLNLVRMLGFDTPVARGLRGRCCGTLLSLERRTRRLREVLEPTVRPAWGMCG